MSNRWYVACSRFEIACSRFEITCSHFEIRFYLTADKLLSEVTFKFDVLCRFINLDETHHSKSSDGDKGGPRATTLTNPNMLRSGSRYAKDSGNHTTGCYGTNPLEAMPAVYIYDSKVKDKTKLKMKADWVKGLPVATGQWGFGREHTMDAHVCVRKGGGMDEELFISTVLCYVSLYPNIHPTFKWSADGKTLLHGPIFIKTDSGNGRQTKSKIKFQFRHDMHKMDVYIGPDLPN